MSKLKTDNNCSLNDVIIQIESGAIKLYKNLLIKSNQFSTQYIIQKVLKDYVKHFKQIQKVVESHKSENPVLLTYENHSPESLLKDFDGDEDHSMLNFLEASKYSITILKNQISRYNKLKEILSDNSDQQLLDNICVLKNEYLNILENEYERLRYKNVEEEENSN